MGGGRSKMVVTQSFAYRAGRHAFRLVRFQCRRALDAIEDKRLGIRTEGVLQGSELGFDNPEFVAYTPLRYPALRKIIGALPLKDGRDVFLDFGCGMGRALAVAAQRPFKRIIGVEISVPLLSLAETNLNRLHPRPLCRDIQLINADATKFPIPDDVTIIYFYNPFHGSTLSAVLDNIRASAKRMPRDILIVSVASLQSDFDRQIRRVPWLKELKREAVPGQLICLSCATFIVAG